MKGKPDAHLPLRWRNAAWIFYASAVCGCINAISLSGVYQTPTSHLTGITTRAAISLAGAGTGVGWFGRSGAAYLLFVLLGFGSGAFIAGFTLAHKRGDGSYASIRLDHPNAREWRWQHQLLVSACIMFLGLSVALVGDGAANVGLGVRPSFVTAVALTSCSVAMFNCMVMMGACSFIVLRAGAVTGSLTDMFYILGSSLRSRSRRYLWKVWLHMIVFFGFVAGSFAGCAVFDASQSRMLSHAVMMLVMVPLWLLGAWFLIRERLCLPAPGAVEASVQRIEFNMQMSQPPTVGSAVFEAQSGSGVEKDAAAPMFQSASSLPRLTILDEFPDEFENEGLGLLIYRLPRINVLEDVEHSVSGEFNSGRPPTRPVTPGEYEVIRLAHFAWIVYMAFTAGSLNAITLQGTFQQPVTHFTGASTVLLDKLVKLPSASATGSASSTFGSLLCIILAFGFGCFLCGFVLTAPSSLNTKKYIVRRIDYPNVQEWRWKHQALVSVGVLGLSVSYAIARSFAGDDKNFVASISYQQPSSSAFLFACSCSAFAAGVINSLSSSARRITVRSSHVTGSVNDIFLGLGFALRSGSLRFVWRVRVLVYNFLAFFTGAVCGSLVFSSSFGPAAVIFPAILLTPLWFVGIGMLFVRFMRKKL
jgi:uncharacterized membrane protein YoaK (UPF0700 family)